MAMREMDFFGICNHVATLYHMVQNELEQEEKYAKSSRCKKPNWGSIANYAEYAFGVKPTEEEVREAVHFFKFE